MSGPCDILRELRSGPKTNAELQEATYDHAGSVSRYAARLIASGRVKRIDGAAGRGTKAIYALADHGSAA
jgi:hypothetical protein